MINIKFGNWFIEVSGHANFKPKGEDVICAAVSAIIQSSVNWFKQGELQISNDDGFFCLTLINTNKENKYKLNLLKIQLESIYQAYPKYINLIKEGEKNEK